MGAQLDSLVTSFEAKTDNIETGVDRMLAKVRAASAGTIKAQEEMATGFEVASARISEATRKVIDSSRLTVLEEGGARIGVFGSALEALGPAGIAAAAGLAAVFLSAEEAKKAFEYGDKIEDTAKALGVTTKGLQEYNFLALKAGVDNDKLTESLKKGQIALGAYANGYGDKRIARAFQNLGITREQAKDSDITSLTPQISDALQKFSPTTQAKLAQATGLEGILPILKEGSAEIQKQIDLAHSLGLVWDEAMIKKAAETNKQLEIANKIISNDLKEAFLSLGPIIVWLAGLIAKMAGAAADAVYNLGHTRIHPGQSDDGSIDFKDASEGTATRARDRAQQREKDLSAPANLFGFLNGDNINHAAKLAAAQRQDQEASARIAQIKKEDAAPASTANTPVLSGGVSNKKASDAAIDQAVAAELAARLALTGDLQKQHQIRLQQIDAEEKTKLDSLKDSFAKGTISKTAYQKASASTSTEFDEKRTAENRKAEAAQAQDDLKTGAEITDLLDRQMAAQAAMTGVIDQRLDAEVQSFHDKLNQARAEKALALAQQVQSGQITQAEMDYRLKLLDQAQSAELLAKRLQVRVEIASEQLAIEQQMHGLVGEELAARQQLATTAAERARLSAEALKQSQSDALAKFDNDNNPATNPLSKLSPEQYAAQRGQIVKNQALQSAVNQKDNQDPLGKYIDSLKDVQTAFANVKVKGLESLTDGITEAIMGTKKLGAAFHDIAQGIIADLVKIGVQQLITQPLANALFGSSGTTVANNANPTTGLLGTMFAAAGHLFGFADGGIAPGGPVLVGERGAEIVDLPAGSKITNNLSSMARMGSSSPQMGGGQASINYNLTTNVSADRALVASDLQAMIAQSHITAIQTARSMTANDSSRANRQRLY